MGRAMLGVLAGAMLALPPPATAAPEIDPWHATHVCRFPTHGTVTIELDGDRGVTMNGTFYPVQSGSYFFQGTEDAPLVDGDPFVIMFGPNLSFWELYGERSEKCEVRAGPPRTGEAGADDRRLEGMDYNEARKIIVGEYGWTPQQGACEGAGAIAESCRSFPEVETCSGTGLGLCTMFFSRLKRCLLIATIGGPPDRVRDGEPAVQHVFFLEEGSACPPREERS